MNEPAIRSGLRFVDSLSLEHRSFGHDTCFDVAPECDEQLPCQRHDPDLPSARSAAGEALLVPLRERTLGLVAEPSPGDLDGHPANPAVARRGSWNDSSFG